MKVVCVNKYFYERGGAEVSFFNTLKILEENGHCVIPFSMHHENNYASNYEKYFVSNVNYQDPNLIDKVKAAGRLLYSLESKKRLAELLSKEKIDLAHLNNIAHQISPSIIHVLKSRSIPTVMTIRDYKLVCPSYNMLAMGHPCEACKNGHYYNAAIKKCHKGSRLYSALLSLEMTLHHNILRIYEKIDLFIATSHFLKTKIQAMGFNGKIKILPNCVNLEEYVINDNKSPKPLALYFGRLSNEKGLDTLCEAMKGLNVELLIVGDGPEKSSLLKKVTEENIENIQFMDHQPQDRLRELILRCWFVILPSQCYETFGRTILEAFALGRPVIGANIGAIPELVKNGETGYLFEPGDVADLRDKMSQLLADKLKMEEMGMQGRRLVEEDMNEQVYYERLMTIYQSAINSQ